MLQLHSRHRSFAALAAAGALVLIAHAPASAAVFTATPADDAQVRIADGIGGVVNNGSDSINVRGFSSIDDVAYGYLEFDLADLPAGADLQSASLTLRLSQFTAGSDPTTLVVQGYDGGNGSIDPGDADKNMTPLGSADIVSLGLLQINLDADTLEQQIADGDLGNFLGLDVAISLEDQAQTSFSTIESTNDDDRPSLSINYAAVPEPASLALMGVGLGMLAVRRRRA